MKQIFALLLSICFAVSLFAQNTVSDEKNVFTVEYPDGWKARDKSFGEYAIVEIQSPKATEDAKKGEAVIMIRVEALPKRTLTLDAVVKEMMAEFKKVKDIKLLSNKRIGQKQVMEMSQSAKGRTVKSKSYFWVANGKLVSATYGAEGANYQKYAGRIDEVINSFKMN